MEITTVYTRERLLRFNSYVARSKTALWWIIGICTLIVIACTAWLHYWGLADSESDRHLLYILLLDGLFLFLYLVLPRFTVKKQRSLNATVTYTFEQEQFRLAASGPLAEETATIRYGALRSIAKNKTELYLFVSRAQAYVVDLSALSEQELAGLKALLEGTVKPRKFKWK